jgi:hypothetical protein
MDRGLYSRLLSYASEAATFGHAYRVKYEELHRQGKLYGPKVTRYSISLTEIWAFAAIAALSGIIGNVAYDVVKAALSRITSCLRKGKTKAVGTPIPRLLRTEEGVNIFIQHVQDFCNGLRKLDPDVKRAIVGEMMVHLLVDLTDTDGTPGTVRKVKLGPRDEEALKEILMRPFLAGSITDKPVSQDFDGFWHNLSVPVPSKRGLKKGAKRARAKRKPERRAKNRKRR